LLPLFYHGQHSGTVFLSDHNFLPAKVGTIMPEKKMLVAVGIQKNRKSTGTFALKNYPWQPTIAATLNN
ncbi:MAG: hypothetical protein KAZ36_09585, partial [Bacteroidales bacterium]|nr:hypothetical protein [Bacteroidales bacterium]